jgi:hypothetical protein
MEDSGSNLISFIHTCIETIIQSLQKIKKVCKARVAPFSLFKCSVLTSESFWNGQKLVKNLQELSLDKYKKNSGDWHIGKLSFLPTKPWSIFADDLIEQTVDERTNTTRACFIHSCNRRPRLSLSSCRGV